MLILDTHTLLFFLNNNPQLPESLKQKICIEKEVAVSIASLWEIAIKESIGKLRIDCTLSEIQQLCYEKDIVILPIKPKELDIIKTLPQIHGDPFDRLLVSQAISNSAIIATRDAKISLYPVRTLWN